MALSLRQEAIESFFQKEYSVIVATDVLASGIDFEGVNLVINYDLPKLEHWTTYVHRLGRTARLGNNGVAVTFYKRENDFNMAPLLCQASLAKCA
uniref:Helicase C-terminal domain-containing protein n=1 Tax=Syphacia muris TaxID=451379 RepID=A0A0N5AEK7_9BILA